jgi:hypothetical protein
MSIQATGSFDSLNDEYRFSLCSGQLVVSFDFLSRRDIEHIKSCLDCLLETEPSEGEEQ